MSDIVDNAASICRSAAEQMVALNIQWRLDPQYIIRLCDEVEALRAERDACRKALKQAEKIVAAASRQKETDHIGNEWFTELATAAQIHLPMIRDALASPDTMQEGER